ncbi:MAG: TatD family hydrolase [Myxococcota bacterium]
MLVDTHCHVHHAPFDADRDQVLQRARDAGVERFVAVGCDLADSTQARDLARAHDDMVFTAGIHPTETAKAPQDGIEQLRQLAQHPKCVAIGECGMDFYHTDSEPSTQRAWFADQIELAKVLDKPLVVHVRDAWDDCLSLLDQKQSDTLRGIIHCFTGTWEHACKAMELGFWISLSGIVTFHNARQLQEVAARLPLERILLETDCPYLAPAPHRGKRNEPAHVSLVARKVAQLQALSAEELMRQTGANARQVFPALAS